MSVKKVKRKNGEVRWIARIRENGRGSKRLFKAFERKVDADDYLIAMRDKHLEAFSPKSEIEFPERTFGEEAAYWLKHNENRFSASHMKRVTGILNAALPRMGQLSPQAITPEFLSRFQAEEKAKGSANATVNRKTEVLTAILVLSAKHRRISHNPSIGFDKFKSDSEEMLYWSEAEARDFLTAMDQVHPFGSKTRWRYAVYLVALNTGLRAGEIWGLQPIDIGTGGRLLHVRRQLNRVTNSFTLPKGKQARTVPCSIEVRAELESLVKIKSANRVRTIFVNHQGDPVCHDNFASRDFAQDLKSWGGRTIRFHDLRHTATTLLVSKGIDLKTVKEICGHANIQTTMRYAHLVGGAVERVAEMFAITSDGPGSRDGKLLAHAKAPLTIIRRKNGGLKEE